MKIEEIVKFDELAGSLDSDALLFTERGGHEFPTTDASRTLTAFVGPEGGWDDSELNLARSRGFQLVTLGGRILRAETAAIAITAILQHRFGDVN